MANNSIAKKVSVEKPDSGWSWVVAAACCFIHIVMFGLIRIAGQLFVITYSTFPESRKEASFPYSLSSTMRGFSVPIVAYLGHRFGLRVVITLGSLIGAVGVATCYDASNIQWIIIFWGIVYGTGYGMATTLLPHAINQYFVKYRATASGLSFTGACLGSMILPSVVDALLDEYGFHGTFLLLGGITLNCVPAAMFLRKPSFTARNNPTQMKETKTNQLVLKDTKKNDALYSTPDTELQMFSAKQSCLVPEADKIQKPKLFRCVRCTRFLSHFRCQKQLYNQVYANEVINVNCHASTYKCGEQHEHLNVSKSMNDVSAIQEVECADREEKFPTTFDDRSSCRKTEVTKDQSMNDSVKKESIFLKKLLHLCVHPMFLLITINQAMYTYVVLSMTTTIVDFAEDMGVEYLKTKHIVVIMAAGDLLGRLCLGYVTDAGYLTKSTFTCFSFILLTVATIGVALASSFWALMAVSCLYGVSRAGMMVIYPSLIAMYIDDDLQILAIPLSQVLCGPSTISVSPTIGFFRETLGSYLGMFYTQAGMCLIFAAAWFFVSIRERCKS